MPLGLQLTDVEIEAFRLSLEVSLAATEEETVAQPAAVPS